MARKVEGYAIALIVSYEWHGSGLRVGRKGEFRTLRVGVIGRDGRDGSEVQQRRVRFNGILS